MLRQDNDGRFCRERPISCRLGHSGNTADRRLHESDGVDWSSSLSASVMVVFNFPLIAGRGTGTRTSQRPAA